jgi:four helix bundle protein
MQAICHHKLRAYGVAVRLLEAVRSAEVRDATLRDHAMRSAKSACLNAAEGAGRVSRWDKARAFTIAEARRARRRQLSRLRSRRAMRRLKR